MVLRQAQNWAESLVSQISSMEISLLIRILRVAAPMVGLQMGNAEDYQLSRAQRQEVLQVKSMGGVKGSLPIIF